MKVERTLVALGLVLAVAGIVVAVNGYVYVNVDRGPPLMISGTLLLGIGLTLAALGFILRELQKISADASKAALLLAKARNGLVAAEPPVAAKPLPPLSPFEPPAAAPVAAPLPSEPEPAPAKIAEPEPAPPSPADMLRRPSFPPPLAPRPEPPKSLASSPFSWMLKPNAEKPAAKAEDEDWLDKAISAEAETANRPGKQEETRQDEPEASPAREVQQVIRREFGLSAEEEAPKPPAPEPAPEPEPKPEVIGNYEAHGAHYTMFADGSIEAETQHGVYRFASIDELKRFIEGEEEAKA
ncbi:hypothetical protein M2323_002358 [Rhodoblastus acidophilus]|uniref:hypothetical protein n=1 Tax=Rhodoblastus acidophilus TaxID=1074 RepID=UPI002223F4EE|nr:hypothetical protein [Rhodoblastus acidophilus]MCW2286338.1 hypothetical protein [Rhodoblastus acidophilus]MCW2333424.1 hypothetical protein [Rhodoblastus acidophilus]